MNTQAEYVFNNKRTSQAIYERRCIIPVTGYFEPFHIGKKSFPHLIRPKHDPWLEEQEDYYRYLGLLGVYNEINDMKLTSILTGPANPFMQLVHNSRKRQPIMLDPSLWVAWLEDDLGPGQIEELMFGNDTSQELEAFTVARPATNARAENDVKEVLQPKYFPEVEAHRKKLLGESQYDANLGFEYEDRRGNQESGTQQELF